MALSRDLAESTFPLGSGLGVVAPPPIHIEAPAFEGSLATLLRLVREQRVHLLDVPLAPVCEAYFQYLLALSVPDLDEAAAALIALAYLLERKAWALLPIADPQPEPEEPLELPEPTVGEFSLAIEALKLWHDERSRRFFRSPDAGPDPYELPYTLSDVKVDDLARALERVLARAVPAKIEQLAKPVRSLSEMMKIVMAALTSEFRALESMIQEPYTREEAVYWFLSLLELIRLARVRVRVTPEEVGFAIA